ncbi:TPA: V-type ATP synthase subunit A, partial [Candidatus Bathyarchaeota archaeon]|nr:V-type ATP synthase subunit A [Candidatus Bathyarchaeota archaeon]
MGSENAGTITRISGSLIVAEGMTGAKVGDMVEVGDLRLIGEIIGLYGENVAVQCYEDTTGLRPGEKVIDTGRAIYAELGPGLIGVIFDGLERSEVEMLSLRGSFVGRGLRIPPLSRKKRWHFVPKVKPGERVIEGDIIGTVQEGAIEHRIMVPVGLGGTITDISEGEFRVTDPVASLESRGGEEIELTMMQTWPVRVPRPYKEKVTLTEPLVTGQRVIDSFFPVAKGGTAAIPGGFGTGKTVLLQQIAKWADSDIIIYVGCGERGNEMADLITHFPELIDPKTGKRLMERTVIIANVSNMPVSAREASVYMGVTIAEYFRDQGYDVALMADSTSRWAEAMRDISGRLGEMPVERGYPAYLSDRTAGFYERAGRVVTLGRDRRKGSITILGAVSPPGGDFSEPVTQLTLRYIETFWALDFDLAARR